MEQQSGTLRECGFYDALISTSFKLALALGYTGQLQITDVLGRTVKTINLQESSGTLQLNAAELGAKGIYYIILQQNGRTTKTAKLITQ